MKLYVYDHCPFCVKARMIFGFQQVPFELIILLNDDISTPMRMIGKKMLPILEDDKHFMGESMDIIRTIDRRSNRPVLTGPINPAIERWLSEASSASFRLTIPRWADARLEEFWTPAARTYFTQAKEGMIGAFPRHVSLSEVLINRVNSMLVWLAPMIVAPNAVNGQLSEDDIHLFAMLRGLSIVKGVTYPTEVEEYRQQLSLASGVPLHDSIAF